MAQLSQSIDLIDRSIAQSSREASAALGFYALLPYAKEYWIQHLEACQSQGTVATIPAYVQEQGERLLTRLDLELDRAGHSREGSREAIPPMLSHRKLLHMMEPGENNMCSRAVLVNAYPAT